MCSENGVVIPHGLRLAWVMTPANVSKNTAPALFRAERLQLKCVVRFWRKCSFDKDSIGNRSLRASNPSENPCGWIGTDEITKSRYNMNVTYIGLSRTEVLRLVSRFFTAPRWYGGCNWFYLRIWCPYRRGSEKKQKLLRHNASQGRS